MLCAVTSSARWWASRPLSAVLRPKKAETVDIALRLEVEGPERDSRRRLRRRLLGRRAVARVGRGAHDPREVVEERALLTPQRAVDVVLVGDLADQAAPLRAALPRRGAVGGRHERGHRLEGDGVAGQPEPRPGLLEQAGTVGLQPAPGLRLAP